MDGALGYIVLDPVGAGELPEYCTHGNATCAACGTWCWLGSQTGPLVEKGMRPICLPCAKLYADPRLRLGSVEDHRRADGPHS